MIIPQLLGWISPQHLMNLAGRLGANREYIIYGEQRLTRRQVFAQVETLAAGLQGLGVEKGDRVVTLLPPCPEAVYALFMPWVLGNIEVPLNPLLREHELRHILTDCKAKAIITTQSWLGQDYPGMLARLLPDLPHLQTIVIRGLEEGDGQAFFSLDEVMTQGKSLRKTRIRSTEIGRITYTSGTTGVPKGVVHTWDRYWGLVRPAIAPRLSPRFMRCLLLPFPLCYYSGLLGVIATLLAGGKSILLDRFDPRLALRLIEKEQVSEVGGSPTMFRLLLAAPGLDGYDLSSVRRVSFSSEPMPFEVAQALHERFQCTLEQSYGMNETGHITWTGLDDPWQMAATTVGYAVPGARVRIVDDERRTLPTGERGEVAVQTSQLMLGYYGDPEVTAEVIDAEGWFYTGDIGYLGDDGYLRLVDRKKDLIIRGGQNVYPAEVEAYLERHPSIRRAAVVGVPSETGGEAVWAYVQLRPGATLASREVKAFCRGQIASFKIPRQVRFVERLPTTINDKLQRFKLREMAVAEQKRRPQRSE